MHPEIPSPISVPTEALYQYRGATGMLALLCGLTHALTPRLPVLPRRHAPLSCSLFDDVLEEAKLVRGMPQRARTPDQQAPGHRSRARAARPPYCSLPASLPTVVSLLEKTLLEESRTVC